MLSWQFSASADIMGDISERTQNITIRAAEAHEHKPPWEPVGRQESWAVADKMLEAQHGGG